MISFKELVAGRKAAAKPTSSTDSRAASTFRTPSAGPGGQRILPPKVDAKRMSAGIGKGERPGTTPEIAHAPDAASIEAMRLIAKRAAAAATSRQANAPIDAAAFVLASAAKARGQKATALAKPLAPIKANLSSPEDAAAFVLASAAKARGGRR